MGCDRVRYLRLQRFTSRKEVIHGNPQKAGLEEDHEICGQARSEGQGKEEVNSTPRSVETNISPGLVPGRSFLGGMSCALLPSEVLAAKFIGGLIESLHMPVDDLFL